MSQFVFALSLRLDVCVCACVNPFMLDRFAKMLKSVRFLRLGNRRIWMLGLIMSLIVYNLVVCAYYRISHEYGSRRWLCWYDVDNYLNSCNIASQAKSYIRHIGLRDVFHLRYVHDRRMLNGNSTMFDLQQIYYVFVCPSRVHQEQLSQTLLSLSVRIGRLAQSYLCNLQPMVTVLAADDGRLRKRRYRTDAE
uniref:Uncharacterized protein n=1 Tax=Glossina pallidipes TaxID=7398 RepID=A0A1B0A2M1_GLOPL